MTVFKEASHRTAVILNKKAPLHQQMAGLAHIMLGLSALYPDADFVFHDYQDADGQTHGKISEYPIAILTADNSNKLRQLRDDARGQGIKTNDFMETMLRENSETQLRDTAAMAESALEYIAIAIFGPGEIIRQITKKCSAFRGPAVENAA